METGRPRRLSLQTKVLVSVLAVLVTLPAVTLVIVNRRFSEQVAQDAELARSTAQRSFVQAMKVRTDGLTGRFRTVRGTSQFLQIVRLNDSATLQDHLRREVLEAFHEDAELVLYFGRDGALFAHARAGAPGITEDAFATGVSAHVRAALAGTESSGIVSGGGMVYHAVAVPVMLPERGLVGAVVFGVRLSDAVLRDVQPPSSEILVLTGSSVVASTLHDGGQNDAVLRQLAAHAASGQSEPLLIGGQRFQPITGTLSAGDSAQAVRYVVLSSSEEQLRALERTRTTLLIVSLAGIVISAVVVWFFVRRITRPLVELRDSAEAVGRGDFSRRINRISNDECGDLAETFNRMTGSLQGSRAELERAMQTLKATQTQLIQSEKLSAVGQFVAGVAHELNNPLTAVVGFSELLESTTTDDRIRKHVERIGKSAHRCHKIVQSLLSFARQHPPERKLVRVHPVIDEVLELMAYELRTGGVQVVKEYGANIPNLMGDAHQLQQVLVNIISNSRQAMEGVQRDGQITIRTAFRDGKVIIELGDNGPGIKPENLARIFDPFFTTKPVGKGTGLGLSLCYGIVREHGGNITARSEPGQGAVFALELPPAEEKPVGGEKSAHPFFAPPALRTGAGRAVLVIDDEPWILDLAAELLRGEGHAVETVQSGEAALSVLGTRSFDVIVSDWKMPGLNGVRLYEHLAATRPDLARRVLFMTGDVVNDTFQNFLESHRLACLSKPFAAGEFRAAVSRMFALG